MEQQMVIFNILITLMFLLIIFSIAVLVLLGTFKEKREIIRSNLELKKIESENIKQETLKSKYDLEVIELQIKYENMFKNSENRTISLAESANKMLEEIGRGEK